MKVSKWGDRLAILLPDSLIESHNLKEGDEIHITITRPQQPKTSRTEQIEQALANIRAMRRPLPPGFRFDREEANERESARLKLDPTS
jgi:antitoxin MazE